MSTQLRGGFVTEDPRLDRLPQFDERSKNYPIRALLPTDKPRRSYTWRCPVAMGPDGVIPVGAIPLDQLQEGACVGFSVAMEAAARPVLVKGVTNEVARQIYRRAQQLDEWAGECVDEETQCLTRSGWKGGNELLVGDEILTFDIESGTTKWSVVEKVHHYSSKPYRVWSHRGFAVAATDNHRWPVRPRNNGLSRNRSYRMVTTDTWTQDHELIRSAPCSELVEEPKYDDDFVELVAWLMCEGTVRNYKRWAGICRLSQKVHLERVAQLMDRVGGSSHYDQSDGCRVWECNRELSARLLEAAPGRAPTVQWLTSLTARQLSLFLETCILADGSETPASGNWKAHTLFSQKTGLILDSWLAACALAGQPVSRSSEHTGDNEDVEVWTVRHSNATEVRKLAPSLYVTGAVWCPQTEMGTFVARRKGTVFITGNSYEGTSVLAGLKAGVEWGWYQEYRWALGPGADSAENDLALAVGYRGPGILGTWFYRGMFSPDADGYLNVTGERMGGHAYMVNAYSIKRNAYWVPNSWGGAGAGWLRASDVVRLLDEDGEAAIPTIRTKKAGGR